MAIDVSFPNAVKYKNPPPKRKLQRGSVKSVMKKKGKEEGSFIPIPAPRRPVRQLPNP